MTCTYAFRGQHRVWIWVRGRVHTSANRLIQTPPSPPPTQHKTPKTTHVPGAVVDRVADVEHGGLDLVDAHRVVQGRVRLVHPQDERVGHAWFVGVGGWVGGG